MLPYVNQFNLASDPNRRHFPEMLQDNTEVLNKLMNTDDAVFQDLMKNIKEKEKETSTAINDLRKITIETDQAMKSIKEKQDTEWATKSDNINKEFQKKSKELKFNQNNFEEGTEAEPGIARILSLLITNMDAKGNIDINDYDDIKDELEKFLKKTKDKIENKDYKYDETKAFYRKMISLLKQSITPENMNSSDIKERINTINTNVINRMNEMGAIESWIRAILDFFRKISSVYKDLYEATSDFSEDTDALSRLCNDFNKAKTREEKEEITKQIINTYGSLKNTILSLKLTQKEKESFKKIEEMVKKLNKSSVNVADFATNFMRIVGAQATTKAFDLSGDLKDKSDIAEKRAFFTGKILEDIKDKIKNTNKASIIATKYVGDGKDSTIDTEDIHNKTGIEEDKIKEIMNGACYNEISLINKKKKSETSNSKAEYDATQYIINEAKMAKKKVETYQSIIEDFSKKYKDQIEACLQKIMEQKTIYEDFNIKYNANAYENVIRDIKEKISLLENIDNKIKADLKYDDNEAKREEQIEADNKKITDLKKKIEKWERENKDEIKKKDDKGDETTTMVDKSDKAEELSRIRLLKSELKNSAELKFTGYETICSSINKIITYLNNVSSETKQTFQSQGAEQKTLNERYSAMTKEKIKYQNEFFKNYVDLRHASIRAGEYSRRNQ